MMVSMSEMPDESTVSVPGWKWNEIRREVERLQRAEHGWVHDKVPFGRAVTTTAQAEGRAEEVVRENFLKTKAFRFPRWEGDCTIEYADVDRLRRFKQVGWYAEVPAQFVTNDAEDQIQSLKRELALSQAARYALEEQVQAARKALGWDDDDDDEEYR